MIIQPLAKNVVAIELKPKEVSALTGKTLINHESRNMTVLNYGRVLRSNDKAFNADDVILFQKLASHVTNFGTPAQLLVPVEQIEAKLEEDTND